jgi:hypothetical protein
MKTTQKLPSSFSVTTEVKEGVNTNMLLGLLPHQWNNLASNSAHTLMNTLTVL